MLKIFRNTKDEITGIVTSKGDVIKFANVSAIKLDVAGHVVFTLINPSVEFQSSHQDSNVFKITTGFWGQCIIDNKQEKTLGKLFITALPFPNEEEAMYRHIAAKSNTTIAQRFSIKRN